MKNKFLASFLALLFCGLHTLNGQYRVFNTNCSNSTTFIERSLFKEFQIEFEGDIELTANDQDIKSMSKGAFLKISKSNFGVSRKLVFKGTGNGAVQREFYVGWRQRDYKPEGEDWFKELMPYIVRSTGIGAPERVNRFYRKGGVAAVLAEVKLMESNSVKITYLDLLRTKNLSNAELIEVLKGAQQVNSSFYLAGFLKNNPQDYMAEASLRQAYVSALGQIKSDHYLQDAARELSANQNISNAHLIEIFTGTSATIGSDFYAHEALISVLNNRNLNSEEHAQIVKLAEGISSDYYLSEFLTKAIRSQKTQAGQPINAQALIGAMAGLGSDHYNAQVVAALCARPLDENSLALLLERMALNIESDFYLETSLKKVVSLQNFGLHSFENLLKAFGSIASDQYASNVMVSIARNVSMSDAQLSKLISIAGGQIQSDFYLANALSQVAPLVKASGPQAGKAYWQATKNIQSDTYLGKATRALRP
jgi:hypothetical protein